MKSAAFIAFGFYLDAASVITPTSDDYMSYRSFYLQSYSHANMTNSQRSVFFSCPTTSGFGSPDSEDSSQYSDSESVHFESNRSFRSSLEDQQLGGELYYRLVLAFHFLARDPSPRVARLGKHILELIGIDHLERHVGWNYQSGSTLGDLWGHFPSSNRESVARSSSWLDFSTGNIQLLFLLSSSFSILQMA